MKIVTGAMNNVAHLAHGRTLPLLVNLREYLMYLLHLILAYTIMPKNNLNL